MKRKEFTDQFKALLPDLLSHTSIDLDDIETSTLLFVGNMISRMTNEAQRYFDKSSGYMDDLLINIVADKYQIEW